MHTTLLRGARSDVTSTSAVALAGALLVLVSLAGCSSAQRPAPTASDLAPPPGLAVAACMRDKGYDFADPDGTGSDRSTVPEGVEADQWTMDLSACAERSGVQGEAKELPGAGAIARAAAACIREHGYEDFPDDPERQASYTRGDAAAFEAVREECRRSAFGDRVPTETGERG